MRFTGFELDEGIPDKTTLCRFRNRMVELNITKRIFRLINKELEKNEIKVESSAGALVDATIVE